MKNSAIFVISSSFWYKKSMPFCSFVWNRNILLPILRIVEFLSLLQLLNHSVRVNIWYYHYHNGCIITFSLDYFKKMFYWVFCICTKYNRNKINNIMQNSSLKNWGYYQFGTSKFSLLSLRYAVSWIFCTFPQNLKYTSKL